MSLATVLFKFNYSTNKSSMVSPLEHQENSNWGGAINESTSLNGCGQSTACYVH